MYYVLCLVFLATVSCHTNQYSSHNEKVTDEYPVDATYRRLCKQVVKQTIVYLVLHSQRCVLT